MIGFIVWFAIVCLPVIIFKGLRDSKNEKIRAIKWQTGVLVVCAVTVGMQIAGIAAAAPKYDSSIVFIEPYYLSYEKSFELSHNRNVIVFVMDTLDVRIMDDLLRDVPEIAEQLDGFTYYRNNVSEFMDTIPSVINMLTDAERRAVDNYTSKQAWENRIFIDDLKDDGFLSKLILDNSTFSNFGEIYERADNIRTADSSYMKIRYDVILNRTFEFSFSRLLPKSVSLTNRIDDGFGNAFIEWGIEDSYDMVSPRIEKDSDVKLFNNLREIGLSAPHSENVFAFKHLCAAHSGGYFYNEQEDILEFCEKAPSYETRVISGRAGFVILREYFRQMKELGIYDDSAIIIIADHGIRDLIIEANVRTPIFPLTTPVTSALLIKQPNSHGEIVIDSDSQLSHKNFAATVLQLSLLCHEEYGMSYFDIIESGGAQIRYWRETSIAKNGVLYVIDGDANDLDNWVLTD
jgi:hypothetical protein